MDVPVRARPLQPIARTPSRSGPLAYDFTLESPPRPRTASSFIPDPIEPIRKVAFAVTPTLITPSSPPSRLPRLRRSRSLLDDGTPNLASTYSAQSDPPLQMIQAQPEGVPHRAVESRLFSQTAASRGKAHQKCRRHSPGRFRDLTTILPLSSAEANHRLSAIYLPEYKSHF